MVRKLVDTESQHIDNTLLSLTESSHPFRLSTAHKIWSGSYLQFTSYSSQLPPSAQPHHRRGEGGGRRVVGLPVQFGDLGLLENEFIDFIFLTLFKGFVVFPSQQRVAIGTKDIWHCVESSHEHSLLLRSWWDERDEKKTGWGLWEVTRLNSLHPTHPPHFTQLTSSNLNLSYANWAPSESTCVNIDDSVHQICFPTTTMKRFRDHKVIRWQVRGAARADVEIGLLKLPNKDSTHVCCFSMFWHTPLIRHGHDLQSEHSREGKLEEWRVTILKRRGCAYYYGAS